MQLLLSMWEGVQMEAIGASREAEEQELYRLEDGDLRAFRVGLGAP